MRVLTREEVQDFTGYKQPARQIKSLKSLGVRFHLHSNGHPIVTTAAIEAFEKRYQDYVSSKSQARKKTKASQADLLMGV